MYSRYLMRQYQNYLLRYNDACANFNYALDQVHKEFFFNLFNRKSVVNLPVLCTGDVSTTTYVLKLTIYIL